MSTLTAAGNVTAVPQPILDKLRQAIARARLVMIVRGCLSIASVVLITLLLGMGIDASFTIFSTALRTTISCVLLSSILISISLFLIRPLARSYSYTGIARVIETRHPELEERLSSAIELLSSPDSDELRGSRVLIEELAKEAVGQIDLVSPQRDFTFRSVRPYLLTASAAVGTLVLLFAIWPSKTSQLFQRIVAPFANIGNVQATDMTVAPGDTIVALGDPLRIELSIADDRVRTASLLRMNETNTETRLRMKSLSADSAGNPRFYLSLPSVTGEFRYRVHSGGAISRYYGVKVVPRPIVEEFEIHYEYPSYASRAPRIDVNTSGKIKGLVGSRVRLVAKSNTPLESAEMAIAGMKAQDAEVTTNQSGATHCVWEFDLTEELLVARTWTVQLKDEHGFVNWPVEYLIQAVRDAPPTIAIVDPQETQLRLKRTDTLPIEFRVEDDFGVRQVSLLVTIDGQAYREHEVPLPIQQDQTLFESQTLIELAKLTRPSTRQMTFQLQAHDHRPAPLDESDAALSQIITVTLDETAESFFETQSILEYSSIREVLYSVLKDLRDAKLRTEGLGELVGTEGRLETATVERIDQTRDLTGRAEDALRELSESLPETSFVSLMSEVLDLAETDVKSARERAGFIKLTDLPEQRIQHSQQSDQHVAQAIERTEKLLTDLDQLWELIQKIADLKELAAQQADLADQLAEVDLEELPELPWKEEQLEVAEEIAKNIQAAPATLQEVLEAFDQEAEDLVEAAKTLSEEQERLATLTETSNQPEIDPEQLREMIAQAIEKQQAAIAQETAELDQQIEDSNKAGEDQSSDLAKKPNDVLKDVQENKFPEATADAQTSAKNLNAAAEALAKDQPIPDLPVEDAGPQDGEPQIGDPAKKSPTSPDARSYPKVKPDAAAQEADSTKSEPGDADGEPTKNPDSSKSNEADPPSENNEPEESTSKPDANPEPNQANDPQNPSVTKPNPVPTRQLAKKSAELAKRQTDVAEQLKALSEGNLDKALELMQENVAEQTEGLATKTEALATAMNLLNQSPQAQEQATQAATQVSQAAEQADQADQQLSSLDSDEDTDDSTEDSSPLQTKPAQVAESPAAQQTKRDAIENQKQASQALATASQNLQNLAQQISDQATAMNLPDSAEGAPENSKAADLAQALASAADTLAQLPAGSAQAATQSAQQAAQSLASAAQAAAEAAGVPAQASPSSQLAQSSQASPAQQASPAGAPSPSSASASQPGSGLGDKGLKGGTVNNDLELKLKDYGISLDQWTRLPGNLKSKIQQAEAADVPEEYRTMVRRYFRELARRKK